MKAVPNYLSVREIIRTGPMGRFQLGVVAICVALNMLDGFDVLVMAFTAPGVSTEFSLAAAQLGVLLSAGLVGMAVGSLFVAPYADRFGRRKIVLVSLIVISLGMMLSSLARNYVELGLLRTFTGVGIGGILATVNVIAAEYSSEKWRNTVISVYTAGYPIGATIGGAISAVLIQNYGWRSAFLFGAVASTVMIPITLRSLPESIDFLLAKRPPGALKKLNAVLIRLRQPELSELPQAPPKPSAEQRSGARTLMSSAALRPTLLIWAAFFTVMATLYFVNSWTPRLLTAGGMSAQQGITGGVVFNLGGLIGTLLFGFVCARADLRRLTMIFIGVGVVSVALFGFLSAQLTAALIIALLLGGAINGAVAGLYALAPGLYTADVRSTGMGWALGIGRLGAILSPVVAGQLIDRGWSTPHLYFAAAVPLALAVVAVAALRKSDARWYQL